MKAPRAKRRATGFRLGLALSAALGGIGWAADFEEAERLLRRGDYAGCVALSDGALKERPYSLQWPLYLIEGLTALGRYEEARGVLTTALTGESRSIRLRWLGRGVYQRLGEARLAERMVDEIIELVASRPWSYREASDLVVFGRAALVKGAEPKQVLERVFLKAREAEPRHREPYLAGGELALEKGDYELAARTFRDGLVHLPEDPDLQSGLARAYRPSEPTLMRAALEAALTVNSNHVPSLLLLADYAIDAESYDEAGRLVDRVRSIDAGHPEAWAYRAVLAHLNNEPVREQVAWDMALKTWTNNPVVPHLIGRKLSQKYRFAEGAARQRQALAFDPAYLPAKAQLAQDLLRLGDEDGWRLAELVHERDGYQVMALNLVTLRDTLARFHTLSNEHFVVRMTAAEAGLYGDRVLELLETARTGLTERYGIELEGPVRIEIFANPQDFAVRTFGLPDVQGFLGVCFGPVVTANSPAARPGRPFNWEAVLWHEFAHVITLQMTRNRMPRWLSEGISVYEERRANPAWGQRMTPEYREMILGGEMPPVSALSASFLAPRSHRHLQFAYYQSSLVVEYLVGRFGFDTLRTILGDLGEGEELHRVLERRTIPMADLDRDFAVFAREQAEALAPELDWEKPPADSLLAGLGETAREVWEQTRPDNYWVLLQLARDRMAAGEWEAAKEPLRRLVEADAGSTGPDSAHWQLAAVHRALGETGAERVVLEQLAERDDKAVPAYLRLMELGVEAGDWKAVALNAGRYLAVNPLVPVPYRYLAQAGEGLGEPSLSARAWRALLQLDPANPAEAHFQLARQLHRLGDPAARQHLLEALEEAPRYRAALQMLLELHEAGPGAAGPEPSPRSEPAPVAGESEAG